ncbi:hypothetical protein ACR820_05240 [Streptomyces netropsis]
MSEAIDIVALPGSRVPEAADALARSLHDDPVFGHIFPRARERERALPSLWSLTLRDTVAFGVVHMALMGDEIVGVAAWFRPGRFPLTTGRRLRCVPSIIPVLANAPRSLPALIRLGMALEHSCPPGPMWYWQVIGLTPRLHGKGIGNRLARAGLELVDQAGLPCHLETFSERNVRWCQGLGFEVTATRTRADGDLPRLWKMVRPGKGAAGDPTDEP